MLVLVLDLVLGVVPVRCSGLVRGFRRYNFGTLGPKTTHPNQNVHELDIGHEKEHEHELDIEHEDKNENDHGYLTSS